MSECPACGCKGAAILLEVHCLCRRCRLYDRAERARLEDAMHWSFNGDLIGDVARSLENCEGSEVRAWGRWERRP